MGIFDFLINNKNIKNENGLNEIYSRNGKGFLVKKYTKKNGRLDGEYLEYFEKASMAGGWHRDNKSDLNRVTVSSGKLKIKCNYINDKKEGKYLEYLIYYRNSKWETTLKIECNYKNNILDGDYIDYQLRGDEKRIENEKYLYKNGIPKRVPTEKEKNELNNYKKEHLKLNNFLELNSLLGSSLNLNVLLKLDEKSIKSFYQSNNQKINSIDINTFNEFIEKKREYEIIRFIDETLKEDFSDSIEEKIKFCDNNIKEFDSDGIRIAADTGIYDTIFPPSFNNINYINIKLKNIVLEEIKTIDNINISKLKYVKKLANYDYSQILVFFIDSSNRTKWFKEKKKLSILYKDFNSKNKFEKWVEKFVYDIDDKEKEFLKTLVEEIKLAKKLAKYDSENDINILNNLTTGGRTGNAGLEQVGKIIFDDMLELVYKGLREKPLKKRNPEINRILERYTKLKG